MKSSDFYSLSAIKKKNAHYNVIFGERSNGKTYAVLSEIINNYVKSGELGAYVRRYREDCRGLSAQQLFAGLVDNGYIENVTNGQYNNVTYYRKAWFLSHIEENEKNCYKDKNPFCYSFALTESKGSNYPGITIFYFDEFIDRIKPELTGEFAIFANLISTLARDKAKMKIYMTANTVNYSSLYFREMGLTNIRKMTPGEIDVYKYGNSKLKCAVEYTAHKADKASDVYFAFNNPHLQMITGKGDTIWELGLYPHITGLKWTKDKVIFSAFLIYETDIVQMDLVNVNDTMFIFCHMKTTEIKNPDTDIILDLEDKPGFNIIHSLIKSNLRIAKRILWFFNNQKVFYADNSVGEIVRNWFIRSGDMRYLKN